MQLQAIVLGKFPTTASSLIKPVVFNWFAMLFMFVVCSGCWVTSTFTTMDTKWCAVALLSQNVVFFVNTVNQVYLTTIAIATTSVRKYFSKFV